MWVLLLLLLPLLPLLPLLLLLLLPASLPPLHQGNPWLLLYSTARDGISLATMMRRADKVAPSLLLVKDTGGAVFGAYVTEPWRFAPRFYGTGESFVFQVGAMGRTAAAVAAAGPAVNISTWPCCLLYGITLHCCLIISSSISSSSFWPIVACWLAT
jgi:hypothetical protein